MDGQEGYGVFTMPLKKPKTSGGNRYPPSARVIMFSVIALVAVGSIVGVIIAVVQLTSSSSPPQPTPVFPSPGHLSLNNTFYLPYFPPCWAAVPNTSWVYVCNCSNTRAVIDLWYVRNGIWTFQLSNAVGYNGGPICPQGLFISPLKQLVYMVPNVLSNYFGYVQIQKFAINTTTGALGGFQGVGEHGLGNTIYDLVENSGNLVWVDSTASVLDYGYAVATFSYQPVSIALFNNFSYILFQSPGVLRQFNITGSINYTASVDVQVSGMVAGTSSALFIDGTTLYMVDQNGVASFQINPSSGTLSSPSSSLTTGTTWQCHPAYQNGYVYNLVNGSTIMQYSGATPLSPASVSATQSVIPSIVSNCGLIVSGGFVSMLSSDRPAVTTWSIN